MPRHPYHSDRASLVAGSVFERFAAKLHRQTERYVKLHIGDTYMRPPFELPLDEAFVQAHPNTFQYCNTFGIGELRRTIGEKLRAENQLDVEADDIMLTSGASNALSNAAQGLLNPGEQVLVLTPAWPFFRGMVRLAGGVVNQLPLYMQMYDDPQLDVEALVENAVTEKTVALYVNTPNNPSGKVVPREKLSALARVAKRHSLWVISDEAYDGLTFDDREHVSIGSLPDMFERTLSIFTFSKAYMFAGLRLGFVAGPRETIATLNKLMVHQLYGPTTVGQHMMVEPMRRRNEWLPQLRSHYQELRDSFVDTLNIDVHRPEGTYFVFFDATPHLGNRDIMEVVDACIDQGVSVAPGGDFGDHFQNHLRLCFTADDPHRVLDGAERLNRVLRP